MEIGGAQTEIPVEIEADNLYRWERFESNTIRPIDENDNTIELKTTKYKYDPNERERGFECRLTTPEIEQAIKSICGDEELNLRDFSVDVMNMKDYNAIRAWNSKEELIFQILICDGTLRLGYEETPVRQHRAEIKKAEKKAERIMSSRHSAAT